MAPLCHPEAKALSEHDFRHKNVQCLPERGLAAGRLQLEGGHVTRGVNVAPGLWMVNCAPLPFSPTELSHRPPVGTTYIPPLLGRPDQRQSGLGVHALSRLSQGGWGYRSGLPALLRAAWGVGGGSASTAPALPPPPTDNKDILLMLSDMDINAIAGTLKLYFRELPEPLLTDRLYPAFMEGIGEQRQGSEGWAEPGLPDQQRE